MNQRIEYEYSQKTITKLHIIILDVLPACSQFQFPILPNKISLFYFPYFC